MLWLRHKANAFTKYMEGIASFLGLHPCPVFDCLQYMKTEEEGMVSISSHE